MAPEYLQIDFLGVRINDAVDTPGFFVQMFQFSNEAPYRKASLASASSILITRNSTMQEPSR